MWRNEVNMRKRERARQQAEELRKMQKLFLLKAMSSPGNNIERNNSAIFLIKVKWLLSNLICVVMDRPRTKQPQDFKQQQANFLESFKYRSNAKSTVSIAN